MEDQVSISQFLQGGFEGLHQVVGELADKAYGIRDQYRAGVGDLQRPGGGVQGVKQPVPGRDSGVGQGIEEGGLAGVGIAHNGHHGDLILLPAVPLDRPNPADLLQVLGELGDLPADVPAVGFQLGFSGAAGSNGGFSPGGSLTDQVPPHTCQPGQQVFVLRQLHLEPPLLGPGPLGKDVQD